MDRRGKRRRIGQIQTCHLLQRGAEGHCHHTDVRHLIHRARAQYLHAQQLMAVRIRHQLDGKPCAARIIMRLVIRHRQHTDRLIARRFRLLLGKPGPAARKPRQLHHARSQNARITHISAAKRKRQRPALHVGGRPHRRPLPLTRETVLHHRAVTCRIHIRYAGRHLIIHQDRALKHLHARILQKARIRPDADGQDHHVCRQQSLVRLHAFRSLLARHAVKLRSGEHRDSLFLQMTDRKIHHLRVEARHDLRSHIDQRHGQSLFQKVLRHFQADKTAANNHGTLHTVTGDIIPCLNRVVWRPHHEHTRQIKARQRRHYRRCTHRYDAGIVLVDFLRSRAQILRRRLLPGRIKRHHFPLRIDHRPGQRAVLLRRIHDQLLLLRDRSAHIIGQSAARIGNVLSLGDDGHLRFRIHPFKFRRSLRSGRHPANYQ